MKKDRYRKYYLIEICVIVAIFICMYPILKVREANIEDIRTTINKNINTEKMNEGNKKELKKLYDINTNDLDDFIYYSPKSNMDEEELLILKVKDEENIKAIRKQIEERVDKKGESFKEYRPEKYEIIRDAIIEEEGKYLIFIVSKDAPNIKEIIKKEFK